ncbi:hypothetical protein SS50377_25993 [Spironucleus salmonicida]|uniref:Myb-like DNA-binding domain-containing protein n=1 Tax=Spironucleus salmonicida TaxID=348837 RepID=V6LHQ3_9EUKA|nr:hypothetical protein SS50377_25993 [Spironucleus salmonicida]|eukprot:EST43221.1 Hypothetical protein SS50377_17085 [Spironucleus salmonicida]
MNKYHKWSNNEVNELMSAVHQATGVNGRISWKQVAECVKYGSECQLKRQYNNIKCRGKGVLQNSAIFKREENIIINQIISIMSTM